MTDRWQSYIIKLFTISLGTENKIITITMRPLSQRDRTSSQKPAFQTKLRLRGSTRSEMKGLDASYDLAQTQRSRHDHQ